jgi:hypothetical protein
LSGSIALNDVASNVDAHIGQGANVTATSTVRVRGLDDSGIRAVAGNGEGAGTIAAGIASSTTNGHSQVMAAIDAASVTAPTVDVDTHTTGSTKSAAAIGAGAGTGAFDVATTDNEIANRSDAHVTNSAHVVASQSLLVTADDSSDILAIAGAGAGAGVVAVAPGISTNNIQNTVTSFVDNNATVDAATASITAADNSRINSVSAGFGGATYLTITGGVGVNNTSNTVDAHVSSGAVVTTQTDTTIAATDASTNGSFTGQAGGALVALGAAASYSEIDNHILAYIHQATVTSTAGSVNVNAVSAATIKSFTGGANGGFVGIAGNVSVVFVGTQTEAYISDATVTAFANVVVTADANDSWDLGVGSLAGGLVGASGAVVVNKSENVTRAFVEGATIVAHGKGTTSNVEHWDPDTGVLSIEQIHGLAVIASFVGQPTGSFNGMTAINAGGGLVGIGGLVSATDWHNHTDAFIAASQINSASDYGGSVIVRAHSDETVKALSGGAAGGLVGVGGTIDRSNIDSETRAFISNSDESGSDPDPGTSVVYGQGVEVSTVTREKLDLAVVGIAGGVVGVSGAVSVTDVADHNTAFVHDSDIFSHHDISVLADDTVTTHTDVGSLGAGAVGLGVSVSVNTIENVVQAQVLGGHLNAAGATTIAADSDETLDPLVMTAGLGAVGVAGTVAVNNIRTTTEATVQDGSRTSLLNQDPAYKSGVSFERGVVQTVTVSANDTALINDDTGTAAAGEFAGVGASVDVGAIRNRTVAHVGGQSIVGALNDVSILAHESRSIDSFVAAFGAGIAGLSAAVSVQSLGASTDSMADTEFNRSVGGANLLNQVDASLFTPDVASAINYHGFGTSPIIVHATVLVDGLGDPTVDGAISATSSSDRGAMAFVDDAGPGAGAQIQSGRDITIQATNLFHLDQSVGSAALGVVSVGASIGIGSIQNNTQAYLGSADSLQAARNISIQAQDHELQPNSELNAIGGGVGFIAAQANVATLTISGNTTARLNGNATIVAAQNVVVEASQQSNVDSEGKGFSAGLAAAGADIATSRVDTNVTADIGAGANVGGGAGSVGNLTVDTIADNTTTANALVGQAGLVAGNDGTSRSTVDANHYAHIGDANVTVTGAVTVNATSTGNAKASVGELAVGLAAGGFSDPDSLVEGSVQARVSDGANIHAPTMTVGATSTDRANSDSEAIGVGLVSGNATGSDATTNVTVAAHIDDANIVVPGVLTINSHSNDMATSASGVVTVALAAGGASLANATTLGASQAYLGTGGNISAGSLVISAYGSDGTQVNADAFGGGVLAGDGAIATAQTQGTAEAYIGNASVETTGDVSVSASSARLSNANTGAIAVGVVAGGASVSNATTGGSTLAHTEGTVHAGGNLQIEAADEDSFANALANAYQGGIVTGSGAVTNATLNSQIRAYANNGTNLTVAGNLLVQAQSLGNVVNSDAEGASIAAFEAGSSNANASDSPTVEASIRNGATVDSSGSITVEAVNTPLVSMSLADTSGGSLIGTTGASATAHAAANVMSFVGAATVHAAQSLLVRTDSLNNAQATGDGTAIGLLLGVGDVHAKAFSGNQTQAYLAAGANVNVGNLTIQSVGNDLSTSSVVGSGGGFISDNATEADSDVSPNIVAAINDGATVVTTNSIIISAKSSPEGDSNSTANAFGAVAVGESDANTTIRPTVVSRVGGNAHVTAGGDVTIESDSGDFSPPSNDTFNPGDVNLAQNTITLANHGLSDGSQVVYQSAPFVPIGGLQDGRQYNVLAVDANTIQFGARFDGAQVDAARDTIKTTGTHDLVTGDRVVYHSDGQPNVSGLVDGQTYFVRLIDATTIKLATTLAGAQNAPKSFAATAVDSTGNTINIPSHGFANNQAVTYHAPNTAKSFNSTLVDVAEDSSGNLIRDTNGKPLDDPGQDDILVANNTFVQGEAVLYTASDPTKAIGNLISGTVYYVIKINNDLIRLATTPALATAGTAIALTPDKSSAGRTVTHSLLPAGDLPIGPLVDGTTYYVVVVNPNRIGLAATPGGPLLDLNALALTGTSTLGTEGIDLAPSSGKQSLDLDFTSSSTGANHLAGPNGLPLSAFGGLSGDGQSSSLATGSGGGLFFGGQAANASTIATPDVQAYVDVGSGQAAIQAQGNITITSNSISNVAGHSSNSSGGLVGSGQSLATANVTNNNDAYVGDNAQIVAGGNITIQAGSNHIADAGASSDGGGLIDLAEADTFSDIGHDTRARTGTNSKLSAGGTISIQGLSSTQAYTDSEVDSGGLGADASANDQSRGDDDPGGVRIGVAGDALTQVEIGAGSQLTATHVQLNAQVNGTGGSAHSEGSASAAGADNDATARFDDWEHANVNILHNAKVTGTADVTIVSQVNNVNIDSESDVDTDAAVGDSDSTAISYVLTEADVTADTGALVTTHTLDVQALSNNFAIKVVPHQDGAFYDSGDVTTRNIFSPARDIAWNSDVFLTAGPAPRLVIDAAGNVTEATNVSYMQTATEFLVQDISFNDQGTAHFFTNDVGDGAPQGTLAGSQSTFNFQENYDTVTILNASTKNVEVINIDPVNRLTSPEVTIDVPVDPFSFNVGQTFTSTLVDIESTGPSGSDVMVAGTINNPLGTTKLVSASGDILQSNEEGLVLTNSFQAQAPLGTIGDSGGFRFSVELVESGGRPTHMSVAVGDDIYMSLQGRQRTLGATSFTVNVDSITAGGEVSITTQAAVRETTLPANWYAVEVNEPRTPLLSEVISHFRPGAGDPPPVVETGAFAFNPVTIDATYNFGLVQGANIDLVSSASTNLIGLSGNTNILSTGRLVAGTNGAIVLHETDGDMRVGVILSSRGNVTLSAPDSIVDTFNTADPDIIAASITLAAVSGSIGSLDNPLDINTSFEASGVLTADAAKDIVINETSGALHVVHARTSIGTIQLTTVDASKNGEDLFLDPNGVISTISGTITLRGGDDVRLKPGSIVQTGMAAGNSITILGDFGNADRGVGTNIVVEGTLSGPTITIQGNVDNDFISLQAATVVGAMAQIYGLDGDDHLVGGVNGAAFFGGNGQDLIEGGPGDDVIDGGDGNDNILAGDGNDTVNAGAGDDFMDGGPGTDFGDGGDGNDNCINFESEINCEDGPILLLTAAASAANVAKSPALTEDQLAPIANEALQRWLATVGLSPAQQELLESATIIVADLPDQLLAETMRSTIIVDTTAAGWGWFVDGTPSDDSEFLTQRGTSQLQAPAGTAADGHMDLLTAVMHEMGNLIGLPEHAATQSQDLMTETLATGDRRLPSSVDLTSGQGNPSLSDEVTAVRVSDGAWTNNSASQLSAGQGAGGYSIPLGTNGQPTSLPWINLDQIQIAFNADVNVQQTSLTLTGVNVANYTVVNFSYDSTIHTATWTLSRSINTDTLHLDLKSAGSGTAFSLAGEDFNFAFNVLPGDANQDGIVNGLDIGVVANNWLHSQGTTSDLNGDGLVNGLDINVIAVHWLASVPAGDSLQTNNGASVAIEAARATAYGALSQPPAVAAFSVAATGLPFSTMTSTGAQTSSGLSTAQLRATDTVLAGSGALDLTDRRYYGSSSTAFRTFTSGDRSAATMMAVDAVVSADDFNQVAEDANQMLSSVVGRWKRPVAKIPR